MAISLAVLPIISLILVSAPFSINILIIKKSSLSFQLLTQKTPDRFVRGLFFLRLYFLLGFDFWVCFCIFTFYRFFLVILYFGYVFVFLYFFVFFCILFFVHPLVVLDLSFPVRMEFLAIQIIARALFGLPLV